MKKKWIIDFCHKVEQINKYKTVLVNGYMCHTPYGLLVMTGFKNIMS